MRLAVIGATGGTGQQLIEQALAAGHDVAALARRPAAITSRHPRLTVFQGDVLDRAAVTGPVADADAVISALGAHHRGPTAVYSAGTAHIVEAMHSAGVRRLICLSSAGVTPNPAFSALQALMVKLLVNHLYPHVYADIRRMEEQLPTSGVDWTIIRAPQLTNGPRTGRYVNAINRHVPRHHPMSRADLAHSILTYLNDATTYHAWVELAGCRKS